MLQFHVTEFCFHLSFWKWMIFRKIRKSDMPFRYILRLLPDTLTSRIKLVDTILPVFWKALITHIFYKKLRYPRRLLHAEQRPFRFSENNWKTNLMEFLWKKNRKFQKKHKNLKNSSGFCVFFEIFDFFLKEIPLDLFFNYFRKT